MSAVQAWPKTPRLVVVASYMRDVSISVDRFPLPGETRVGADGLQSHGGKGSNQAIQAARCGAAVSVVASIGPDAAGQAALSAWRDEGLDTTGVVQRAGLATGLAVIVVDHQGQNQIVIAPGANQALTVDDIEQARRTIESADLLVAQLETPLATTIRAFQLARAANVPTLLNTAPAPESLPQALWTSTDLLIANEIESATLAGMSLQADPRLIGEKLLERVALAVVITLGAQGAMLFQKGRAPVHHAALPVKVKDTTGAGDAFVGAFGACWAATGDGVRALSMGVTAGSLACTARGVVPALADAAAIQAAS